MRALSEDRIYLAGVWVLLLAEVFLAIPLMTDSLIDGHSSIILYVTLGHFFWLMFGATGMVEHTASTAHKFGLVGIFISTILPVIGFTWHIFVVVLLVKHLLRYMKLKKEEDEKYKGKLESDN